MRSSAVQKAMLMDMLFYASSDFGSWQKHYSQRRPYPDYLFPGGWTYASSLMEEFWCN